MRVLFISSMLFVLGACEAAAPPEETPPELLPELAPCVRFTDCASNFCSRGVCGPDECASADGCGDEVCVRTDAGRFCEPAGERGELCHRRTDTPPSGSVDKDCAEGLVCEVFAGGFVTEGSCVPLNGLRRAREACSATTQCEEELVCVGAGPEISQCRRVLDAPCTDDSECASRRCTESRCAEQACDDSEPGFSCRGRACSDSGECASSACVAAVCS